MELVTSQRSSQFNDLLLLVGQTLSQVSDRMVQLGLIWFITSTFGGNFLIWYLVIGGLPHAFLVKFSGRLIQKLSALKTVLYSDLARGVVYFVAFSFVTIFPHWATSGKETIESTYILFLLFTSVFIANIFSAFFNPAIMSLSVEIKEADEIQKLTAKLSSITSFSTILGPIIGLYVFNAFGLSGLFIICSLSYFLSAFALALVNKKETRGFESTTESTVSTDTRFFSTHKVIAVMLLVFLCINLTLSPIQVLMPTLAKDLFGNSFNALAVLEMFLGVGILLGGVLLSVFSIQKRMLFWTWLFLLLMSFSYVGFNVVPYFSTMVSYIEPYSIRLDLILSSVSVFFIGFTLGMANILILNILQTQPKAADVPKVMSYVNLISTATLPFSLAFLGLLQNTFSILSIGFAASLLLVFVVLISFVPFKIFGREIFK